MFSFKNINLLNGLKRFPLAIAFATIATAIGMYVIDQNEPPTLLINILLTCIFGGICNIAATVATEAHEIPPARSWLVRIAILLAMLAFYFLLLPKYYEVFSTPLYRLPFQLIVIFLFLHLLISYIPFIHKGSEEDFWEYNKDLFLNFVESMFYSFFLFVGLSIALIALDKLFGFAVGDLAYPRLFFFLVGIFNTLYFLSKFPTVYYDNQIKTPIKAFLIFSQYILIPLVLIYMAILYAYGIQIGFKWELPQGWVSQLSLWFSVVGIFAFLLNYFNHKFSDLKLTAYYKRYFFLVLLLPIVLIFVAIYRRVSEYGITELRYVVALLGIWLLGVALYNIFSKQKNIRVIPISLSIFVLIPILLGPFNMFNATLSSQKKQFKNLLIENGCLVGQKLVPIDNVDEARNTKVAKLNTDNREKDRKKEILYSAVRFLDNRSDLSFINDWIEPDLDFIKEDDPKVIADTLDQYYNARILAKKLNISSYVPQVNEQPKGERFNFNQNIVTSVELKKNQFFLPIDVHAHIHNNSTIYFKLNKKHNGLDLYKNDVLVGEILLEKYLEDQLSDKEPSEQPYVNYSFDDSTVTIQDSLFNATLILSNIGGVSTPEVNFKIDNIWGHAIIDFKPTQE